jgi:hypothetical protein
MRPRRDEFANLYGLCSAYFHQDWDLDDPTADAVLHRYIGDSDPQEVQQVAAELGKFLLIEMTEDERKATLDDFCCEYYPPGDGLTYSSWLQRVYDILTAKR